MTRFKVTRCYTGRATYEVVAAEAEEAKVEARQVFARETEADFHSRLYLKLTSEDVEVVNMDAAFL